MTNWTKNRRKALRILEMTAMAEFGMELCHLPDLPSTMDALDVMEALMEEEADKVNMDKVHAIAMEAMNELEEAMESEPSYL